ncbi:MAG: hypothetical protein ACFBZ8_06825 [Opitutales bacterium]
MPYALNPTHPCAPEPLHPDTPADTQAIASARAFSAWYGDAARTDTPAHSRAQRSPFLTQRAPQLPRPTDFL